MDGNPCECYTMDKEGCAFPQFQPTPCCDKAEGGCGCSISLLLRVPGSKCQKGYWDAVLTEEEQKELEQITYQAQFTKKEDNNQTTDI